MSKSFDEITSRQQYFEQMDEAISKIIDQRTGKIVTEAVEMVPCPLCAEPSDFQDVFSKQGFDFLRCNKCGLIFVNPQLRSEYIDSLYSDDNTFYSAWSKVLLNPNNQAWQIPYFEEALDILSKYAKSGNLLDIGCSIGLFLKIAENKSYKCIGLELEKEAFEYARSQGLDVRRQTLQDAEFAHESFDVITLFGVLEHLKYPNSVLQDIWSHLKPGGSIMAIVPNVYSLEAMTVHENARMFNGRNHLTYFSLQTIRDIFERNGFVVKHLDTCLTALDSILNYWQYNDPHSTLKLDNLPPNLRSRLETPTDRRKIESLICEFDLGLRLRIVAVKPE